MCTLHVIQIILALWKSGKLWKISMFKKTNTIIARNFGIPKNENLGCLAKKTMSKSSIR